MFLPGISCRLWAMLIQPPRCSKDICGPSSLTCRLRAMNVLLGACKVRRRELSVEWLILAQLNIHRIARLK